MTLTREFVENSVGDLAAPEFQDRLRHELKGSPLVAINVALGALAAGGVLLAAILVVVGHLHDPSRQSLLGAIIIAVVGIACAFLLYNLFGRWRRRRAYQALLANPDEWRLETTVATRVSQLGLASIGSDESAIRILWEGETPGSASVEMLDYKTREPGGGRLLGSARRLFWYRLGRQLEQCEGAASRMRILVSRTNPSSDQA